MSQRLQKHARRMRANPAMHERILWRLLRDRRLAGMKFRRQVVLGPYVADFVCFRFRIVVEADGPFHDPERDQVRDAWLVSQGFRVFRFSNSMVGNRPELVLQQIEDAIAVPRVEEWREGYEAPL